VIFLLRNKGSENQGFCSISLLTAKLNFYGSVYRVKAMKKYEPD